MALKFNPLNNEQLAALEKLVKNITPEQVIWLNGYLEGRLSATGEGVNISSEKGSSESIPPVARLTILYGTETGNAKSLADKLEQKAKFKNIETNVVSMYDFKNEDLLNVQNLAVIVSTHGEGDPPDMAEYFYQYVTNEDSPRLEKLSYSVLALGDKTYKHFCKTGEEIDSGLKGLGAFRMASTVMCDVDYDAPAEVWMNVLLMNLKPLKPSQATKPQADEKPVKVGYSKKNPFLAPVLKKDKITGEDSDKDVYHFELSLEGSGFKYEPGDSVGVFARNPLRLVESILEKCEFDPEQMVDVQVGEVPVEEALTYHLEITVLSYDLIKKYFGITGNEKIKELLEDDESLDKYLFGHDLLDLLEDFPFEWHANKLVQILRPLPPRLYSISSSQKIVEDELHATIAVVRYENRNRHRVGACSSFLTDSISIQDEIPIYIDKNPTFKLPPNGSKIIMVGAGTGIAPYRAFLQERESKKVKGNSWLFYGDRRLSSDFLYQVDWQRLLEKKYLEKMDVAFSRDQKDKVYVQHKLMEKQKEVFEWLENGAYFYLCGDMKNMAKDVNRTLLEIIQAQGGVSKEKAEAYLKQLKREKRFQTDIY